MAQMPAQQPVDAVRMRRAELRAAITALEDSLARPARDPGWISRIHVRTEGLTRAFADHVTVTEGPDGMYADVLRTAPRLAFAVEQLVREHAEAARVLQALSRQIDDLRSADDEGAERVRRSATALLGRLVRHRQRGADLVFEAYAQDIGGCD